MTNELILEQKDRAIKLSAILSAGTVAPDFVLRSTPDQAVSLREFRSDSCWSFAECVGQHSKTREDIKTWFDAIELDGLRQLWRKSVKPVPTKTTMNKKQKRYKTYEQ